MEWLCLQMYLLALQLQPTRGRAVLRMQARGCGGFGGLHAIPQIQAL